MANINRDYLIINDVKKSDVKLDNGSINFYITDKNTQNIFVNLVINTSKNELITKYANIENADDYTVTMNIVKPDNTYKVIDGQLHSKEEAIFEFDLPADCCDQVGTYRCELLTKCNINSREEITTSNKVSYKVKASVLNDLDDIVEAPEYPLVIQLFDKLSDIDQYEEDRRANELARQLAEEQRQQRFDTLIEALEIDNEERDSKIANLEAKSEEQDGRLDVAENRLDNINTNIENVLQPTVQRVDTIEAINATQNDRFDAIEAKNTQQDGRLDIAENRLANIGNDITNAMQPIIDGHTSRLDIIEAIDVAQNNRLDAIEVKNSQQDDRLLDIEKVNKKQDRDIKCLFNLHTVDITEEGNSVYLQNSTDGRVTIDNIQGNTMVNCNKEPDKEIILNGNINTQAYSNVTLTEGVDGGLVDVALEGNTMVNVCNQKDSVAITKSYTVETGNHVALQGEYDRKCRPVVAGNTLVNLCKLLDTTVNIAHLENPTRITGTVTIINAFKTNQVRVNRYNISDNTFVDTTLITSNVFKLDIPEGQYLDKIYDDTSTDFIPPSTLISDVLILEGDYTNKPIPEYFQGLQSSFEDKVVTQEMVDNGEELAENLGKYKVDYVVTGKNKFCYRLANGGNLAGVYLTCSDNGTFTIKGTNNGNSYRYITNIIKKLKTNTEYMMTVTVTGTVPYKLIIGANGNNYYRIINMSIGEGTYTASLNMSTITNMRIEGISSTPGTIVADGSFTIQIEEGTQSTPYEPYKEYTKTLYLNSPLLEGDTIEEKDGNIYHVHRYGRVVLDGSENWAHIPSSNAPTNTDYTIFTLNTEDCKAKGDIISSNIPVPKRKYITADYPNIFAIGGHTTNNQIRICIEKSKLPTPSLNSFKTWLQQNPTTVVYELQTPQYELIQQGTIAMPTYSSGHLDVTTAVPLDKVDFLHFEKDLTYLYANTQYTVQFVSDNATTVDIALGGTKLLAQSIVKGLNRITITTPSTLADNKLIINGVGANISEVVVTQATDQNFGYFEGMKSVGECEDLEVISSNSDSSQSNTQTLTHQPLRAVGDVKDKYVLIDGKWYIERKCGVRAYQEGDKDNYKTDLINTVYPLASPTYEPIDYNPLEVYSGVTHISTNSVIPCNITVKNTGFNCLLKPSTTYTVSSNLGLNTVTTGADIGDSCLRFIDTDTSDVTTMKDVMVLEGDYTTGKPLPSHFSGIESAFEQEYDEAVGKYKVKIRVQNEDATKENYIEFYINEPLRGIGDVKDKVYVKDDKVVVERNWVNLILDGSDDEAIKRSGVSNNNCVRYYVNTPLISKVDSNTTKSYYVISNKFANGYDTETLHIKDIEGISSTRDSMITLSIAKHKLITQDVSGFKQWLSENPVTVVYKLASPTYEEVDFSNSELSLPIFNSSAIFFDNNVPVTSTIKYTYSVPLVDTVAQTANISDQQDRMIIDMATQVAVMEMMLM